MAPILGFIGRGTVLWEESQARACRVQHFDIQGLGFRVYGLGSLGFRV